MTVFLLNDYEVKHEVNCDIGDDGGKAYKPRLGELSTDYQEHPEEGKGKKVKQSIVHEHLETGEKCCQSPMPSPTLHLQSFGLSQEWNQGRVACAPLRASVPIPQSWRRYTSSSSAIPFSPYVFNSMAIDGYGGNTYIAGYGCMSQEERFEMGAESEEDFESRMAFRELMDR